MSKTAEKVLKALYNEYRRTKSNDFVNVNTISDLPETVTDKAVEELLSIGCIKDDVIGDVQLTEYGISCAKN